MSTIEKRALELIKKKTKFLGLTQAKIAEELNVSLPTIKRWFSGRSITVSVIENLCKTAGISLSELFLEAERGSTHYTYSVEQESLFIKHPKVLALFDHLVSGDSVTSIQKKYLISKDEMFSMLLKLDRSGLIQLYENNKIKLVHSGEPQWIPGGQLSQKYRKQMIESLLKDHEKADTIFLIHNYSAEDAMQLRIKFKELQEMMLSFNLKGNSNKDNTKSYGVYMTLKEFEWDLRNLLKK